MRLIAGIIVVAMGIIVYPHTGGIALVQIAGGALLVLVGVRDEIKKGKSQ